MSAARETLAEMLNRDCDCTCTDLAALHRRLDADLGRGTANQSIVDTHPHLFSETPVFLDPTEVAAMQHIVAAVDSVVQLPAYQRAVIGRAPLIAQAPGTAIGAFAGFDFHLSPDGPRLIEINTNAGGAFLNIAAREAQQACCRTADSYLAAAPTARQLSDTIHAMFLREWQLARGSAPLRSIAIVDENPTAQYLYPEFQLAQKMFRERGIETCIVDPAELATRGGRLFARGEPVDLVYNRLTDFYLAAPGNQVLRRAYEDRIAVVTPHPRAHALFADKQNLAILSDADALRGFGVADATIDLLSRGVPLTRTVGSQEDWWRARKDWFFKPRHGFGSRGAYRGDKLTRRVFADVISGHYMAQQFTPPSERLKTSSNGKETFKVDVRCYSYQGSVQLMAARLYQGQTTNFRTAGGGFAPVYVVSASD